MINHLGSMSTLSGWKRVAVYVGCAALLLVLFVQLQPFDLPRFSHGEWTSGDSRVIHEEDKSGASTSEPAEPVNEKLTSSPDEVYHLPARPDNSSYRWVNIKVHHPVNEFQTLPDASRTPLPRVQHTFSTESFQAKSEREERQLAVKGTLTRCWLAYKKRAWLQDELAPISGTARSTFGGWAATLVDALDTLWIMDLKDEFWEAVDAAVNIDFSATSSYSINTFETTIRYLGGFLAAYDLSGDTRLLDKALELGHMLYAAFDTPNRMPITRWDLNRAASGATQVADEGVLVAEIGSFTLEFTRLAQITRDNMWYDAVARIMAVFDEQQDQSHVPGMWPLTVNARDKDFHSGTVFTLGAMADSLYEYLPKMYALLGGSEQYERMYSKAMAAAIKSSIYRPLLPDNADVVFSGSVNADEPGKSSVKPEGQHLICFAGGMLALGGRLMPNGTHVELGRKLTDGCVWTYEASELGIMPETFTALPCTVTECVWSEEKWHQDVLKHAGEDAAKGVETVIAENRLRPGFSRIDDRRYILRPEAIESVFILYRITGQKHYQDKAWKMFQSILEHTKTDIANAAISDVTDSSAPKSDSMESFWMAETLKYFYLIFSEPTLISLDDYVLNTEAHPFKRPIHR
jgi:mannosyl-oligosaccharide alpha-1,2-mannosidase